MAEPIAQRKESRTMPKGGKMLEDGPVRELALLLIDAGWDSGPHLTSIEASRLAQAIHDRGYILAPTSDGCES